MPPVRSRAQSGLNDDRFTFAAPSQWLDELRAFAAGDRRFNGNVSAAIKTGADLLMARAEEEPKPNEISFELSQADADALQKLADALYYEDPNLFAKMIMRRALDLGPDVMREFLLGQVKREVQANLEAENEERAQTNKPASKRVKKAA